MGSGKEFVKNIKFYRNIRIKITREMAKISQEAQQADNLTRDLHNTNHE
jgi:hypothetical protein